MDWHLLFDGFVKAANWLAKNWDVLVLFLAGSGVLAPLSAIVKKFVTKHFHKPTELQMFMLVYVGGILLAMGNYLLHVPTSNPGITAFQGAMLTVGAQPFYFKWIKPWLAKLAAEAAAQEQLAIEAQRALIPPDGLPKPAVMDKVDFSKE